MSLDPPGEHRDALQVGARRLRQPLVGFHADGAFHPAGQLLVDRHAALELLGAHRQVAAHLALDLVADADLHRLDAIEHVELGDAQARDAVDLDRALERRGVEPPGAPRPPRGGAELLAALAQALADVVRELGRERPAADARRIRFCNPQNIVELMRADPGPRRRRAGDAVRRRNERIGAVIDVEQAALRAFEQQVLARLVGVIERPRHVRDQGHQARRQRQGFVEGFPKIYFFLLVKMLQNEIVKLEQLLELAGEALGIQQVLEADRAARHLVLVGRADAAAGGADLVLAARGLAGAVERRVIGQDQGAGFRDDEPRDYATHAGRLELVYLREQRFGRQHHAVADVAIDVAAQDARGDQVQHGLLAGDDQRVAGVVPALEAHHALRAVGQPVDDLALALVAPLRADDDDVARHGLHFFFFFLPFDFLIEARLRKSIENPVAGRALPKAFPTSS